MKLLINYANQAFAQAQLKNSASGRSVGGFDEVISYSSEGISRTFYRKNARILSQKRGSGYWLWKFYFIKKALAQLSDGDFLVYCDAGAHFTGSIEPLCDLCGRHSQDVLPFEIDRYERIWTKRDAFLIMDVDRPEFTDSLQRMAGFMVFRKSPFSSKFVEKLLAYGQDERLITDLKNQLGQPNYPGFKDHRHDQSIWSLLTKKYELKSFRDPSVETDRLSPERDDSPYPQLIDLNRAYRSSRFERFRDEYHKYGFRLFVAQKFRDLVLKLRRPERDATSGNEFR